ncbi:MAG TPA: gluconeogenesis factor YvcK family protein [Candidatus Saccharimonadia bacterium]|nr:gluconeogenesis factor YvcK family protein [Candidatus Saccharimonadia bacterium]
MSTAPKLVLLGGGTGSFTLLQGLKKLTPNITAIVTMSDDGGSTGVLRDELGVLPPGDVRQCLVALSDTPEVRDLFSYRFTEGRFDGQSLGNIILSGLELRHGSFLKAIEVASDILHICGSVVPVTFDKHTLVVYDGDVTHRGEHVVDGDVPLSADATVHLDPAPLLNPDAAKAVAEADLVVIAPGSLHTSLIPLLAVKGMSIALSASSATVVWVANLINKPHQTDDWHVVDYVKQLERYAGEGRIDIVLYNNRPIEADLLLRYAQDGEYPVDTSAQRFDEINALAIGAHFVAPEVPAKQRGDTLQRTLIRHDTGAVSAEIKRLLVNTSKRSMQ